MSLFYSLHVYNLKPGVMHSEFETFMTTEWIPYIMSRPGCKGTTLLRGYRGEWMEHKMDYATLEIWTSAHVNREAWGGPKSTWVTPEEMQPFMERFHSYIQPDSFRTYEFDHVM